MNILQIQQRLESILSFLQPYWSFVNCHMVNYLTDNHWSHFVPKDLQNEVPNIEKILECINIMFWRDENQSSTEFPAFKLFLDNCEKYKLKNFPELLTRVEDLQLLLGNLRNSKNLTIKEFMSEKKNHEVEITSSLVNDLIESYSALNPEKEIFIIDAGDGKGYLSSRLALAYKHKVLGIDANEANTFKASLRNEKLKKAWNGLTKRAEMEEAGLRPSKKGKKSFKNGFKDITKEPGNYKTTSKFITTDLDIQGLLRFHFPLSCLDREPNICLTGLHTCGNLASTCLEVFHAQSSCKILCNIGCCYHLIKESFSTMEYFGNKDLMDLQTSNGFPLSKYLIEKNVSLGRNARMLASQSIERTIISKELPNISLFYRSLLEVLICEKDPSLRDTIQVGKIRKSKDFHHYLEQCQKKLPLSLNNLKDFCNTDEAIEYKYRNDRYYLDLFYLLRMTFAPILESIILLDRLLFLKENGYERSYLVPLFDPVISPRHYAIIAFKD